MPSTAIQGGACMPNLFEAPSGFDDFEHDMSRADDLPASFFEIDRDSIPVYGLNSAQTPVGLVGMAHDGTGRQQEVHWLLYILCCSLQYRSFVANAQFAAATGRSDSVQRCAVWVKFAGSQKPDFKAC